MADREKVINELNECIEHIRENNFHKIPFWGNCQSAMMDALELLKDQQPKTGHWIRTGFGYGKCSECGGKVGNIFSMKYCPYCGAKMEIEL